MKNQQLSRPFSTKKPSANGSNKVIKFLYLRNLYEVINKINNLKKKEKRKKGIRKIFYGVVFFAYLCSFKKNIYVMNQEQLKKEILRLKKEKNAVILGHYYQRHEIQELSDYIGDSLALAQKAQEATADIIVFCGVHFMAETAKILNPSRKVLLPDMEASCSLAESCKAEDFKKFKAEHPDHMVISYVNCSAEIKALSDLICTSGNAEKLVRSLPEDQKIIFAPDKNLGG